MTPVSQLNLCFPRPLPLEAILLEIAYVRQCLTHLRFGLFNRTLDAGLFRIFRQQSVERAAYRAELWVIGTSHVMNVQLTAARSSPESALAEVLTGADRPLPSDGRVEVVKAFENCTCLHHRIGELSYTARIDSCTCTKETFRQREASLRREESPCRLIYQFPQGEELPAAPITVIDVLRADEDGLEIQTFHTYPEGLTIVMTHSTVEVTTT